jgi:uncharacterized protein YPO0396
MPTPRWSFYDPFTGDSYDFEINPNAGGSPGRSRKLTYTPTAAANGKTLAFEGRADPQRFDFSGVILHEAQYTAFDTWAQVGNQIRITDDLGRQFWIIIENWEPKRERAVHYPWKHSYTAKAVVIDWA